MFSIYDLDSVSVRRLKASGSLIGSHDAMSVRYINATTRCRLTGHLAVAVLVFVVDVVAAAAAGVVVVVVVVVVVLVVVVVVVY